MGRRDGRPGWHGALLPRQELAVLIKDVVANDSTAIFAFTEMKDVP